MKDENGFDSWLEQQLRAEAAAQPGPHPMPVQAQYHAAYLRQGTRVSFLAKVAGLLSAKAALSLTLGVIAVSAAGAAGEATITGSTDPSSWGQQVVQQVEKCKAALVPGSHGIGDCVSSFATQHGQQVSDSHQASSARTTEPPPAHSGNDKSKNHGDGNGGGGNGNGDSRRDGNGNGNGHGGGGSGNGHGNGPGGGGNGNGNGNGPGGGGSGGGNGGGGHSSGHGG